MPLKLCIFLLSAGGVASAQVVSFGLRTGIPLNAALRSASLQFEVRTHRYTLGPTVELRVFHGLAFEADLLYKRLEYQFLPQASSAGQTGIVKISRWELPVLLKYRFAGRHFRPFLDLGGSFNRVVHLEGDEPRRAPAPAYTRSCDRWRRGPQIGRLRIAPEVRFTHWADRNFGVYDAPLRSNLTQAEILVGVTF